MCTTYVMCTGIYKSPSTSSSCSHRCTRTSNHSVEEKASGQPAINLVGLLITSRSMAPFLPASNTTPCHPQHLLLLLLQKTDRLRQSNFNRLSSPAFRLNFTTGMVNRDNLGSKVIKPTQQIQCVCFNPLQRSGSYVYWLL